MLNRKKIGSRYETTLCGILGSMGYWCHNFSYGVNGQPCDVIALRGDESFLIDVKHCEGDLFPFSRIEPNQRNCFMFAKRCCVKNTGFAIWFEKDKRFKWLPFKTVEILEKNGKKSVKSEDLYDLGEIL